MAYQVLDIKTQKGMTEAQSAEHLRKCTEESLREANRRGNYDATRDHLNFEVGKGCVIKAVDKEHSIPTRMKANLISRGIKDPNEGLREGKYRTVVNMILGGSREQMRRLAFGDQSIKEGPDADNSQVTRQKPIEEWAKDVYAFVAHRFGEENIVAFVAHLDETTPHIHCTLLPIVNNKFNFTALLGTKNRSIDPDEGARKIRKVQDELYEKVNKRWGLERGEDIRETGAKHRTTEQYRRELAQHMEKLREMVSEDNRLIGTLSGENRKLSEENKSKLTTNLEALKAALKEGDTDVIKTATDGLEKVWHEVSTDMYKSGDGQGGNPFDPFTGFGGFQGPKS